MCDRTAWNWVRRVGQHDLRAGDVATIDLGGRAAGRRIPDGQDRRRGVHAAVDQSKRQYRHSGVRKSEVRIVRAVATGANRLKIDPS